LRATRFGRDRLPNFSVVVFGASKKTKGARCFKIAMLTFSDVNPPFWCFKRKKLAIGLVAKFF